MIPEINSPFVTRQARLTIVLTLLLVALPTCLTAAEPPKVGDQAPDFSAKTLDGGKISLKTLTAEGSVALIMLRGWPGYQCPACDRQVQDFISVAADFAASGTRVAFVYPGPADGLEAHAKEFKALKGRAWPKDFVYALDPDYSVVNAYAVRWDAPRETAYPSTFIIDKSGKVRFTQISRTHGGRSKAADVLSEAKKISGK